MKDYQIVLLLIWAVLILAFFLTTFICYYITFYVGKKKIYQKDEYDIPPGKQYEVFKDLMALWQKEMRELPHQKFQIKSFDNLTLHGNYYPCKDSKTIEITG